MNENIDLTEILKDCPEGTKLYSTIFGEVEFKKIEEESNYPIVCVAIAGNYCDVTADGRHFDVFSGECILFPSKEQRDWSKFKVNKFKFNPNTLQPFDKVLAKNFNYQIWHADIFSHVETDEDGSYYNVIKDVNYLMVIPYNDETKHLVGTTDEAPEYYRYWED